MQTGLWLAAFLMGLAGGPHCVAMCSAACGALCGQGGDIGARRSEPSHSGLRQGVIRPRWLPVVAAASVVALPARRAWAPALLFHSGRLIGYASAGGMAALAMQGLASASEALAWLKPLWLLLHVFVGVWGAALLVLGRQPLWLANGPASLLARARALVHTRLRLFASGVAWVGWPCGLLYSALLLAAMANGAGSGAGVMALFALGSLPWLLGAPWVWRRLRHHLDAVRRDWGTRLAGAVLVAVSAQAVGLDLQHRVVAWCAGLAG